MANYKVKLTEPAESDLEDTYRYIYSQSLMPATALKTVENIKREINNNLSFMPHYPLVDHKRLASMGYHKMVVKKYLAFFVIDEERHIVTVRRIIHGARDWKRILSNEP